MAAETDFALLSAEIAKGKHFRGIDASLIDQVLQSEAQPNENRKETVKRARAKIHQVSNAFRDGQADYQTLIQRAELLPERQTLEELKPFCMEMMRAHASTRERLPILKTFYDEIFAALPPLQSVLDLACGLNPLALPWMRLPQSGQYIACDLYQDIAVLLNTFFDRVELQGDAFQCNLLHNFPAVVADCTFLLKTIPCLEQLQKNAGAWILSRIRSEYAVVSFPIFSLSGRQKGMRQNYEQHFLEICDPTRWGMEKLLFENELVFILKRK